MSAADGAVLEPGADDRTARPQSSVRRERLVLLALIAIPAIFYIARLGYYTDDWAFLAHMHHAPDQSPGGVFAHLAAGPNVAVRPLQNLWYVLFHTLGTDSNPLVAHIANHAVFALSALTLHWLLREFEPTRQLAFTTALVFVCMPHFTASKFWFANHQAVLSMLLGFLAMAAMVRVRSRREQAAGLRLALIGLLTCLSVLAYELLAFVIVAFPAFLWLFDDRRASQPWRDRALVWSTVCAAAGFAIAFAWKLPNFEATGNSFSPTGLATRSAILGFNMTVANFWSMGLYLPRAAIGIAGSRFFDGIAFIPAALTLVTLLAAARWGVGPLARSARRPRSPAWRLWAFALCGGVMFGLALLPFLPNFYVGWQPFGTVNRANAGAAFGVAFAAAAGAHLIALRAEGLARAVVIALCVCGVFVQAAVGRIWGDAFAAQQALYRQIEADIGPIRAGQSVLLYGACPYYGPVPVFSSAWGLNDRLRIDRGIDRINGNTITGHTRLTPEGIEIREWGSPYLTPYRATLIYDARDRSVTRIESRADAEAFFARKPVSAATGCEYADGGGVRLY